MYVLKVNVGAHIDMNLFHLSAFYDNNKLITFRNNRSLTDFMREILDYPPEIEFSAPCEQFATAYQFTFQDLSTYRTSYCDQNNKLPCNVQQAIDLLIAFELFVQYNTHINHVYVYSEEDDMHHHPEVSLEKFFSDQEATSSSCAQRLMEYIVAYEYLPDEYYAVKKSFSDILEYRNKYPDMSFIQCLLKIQCFHLMGLTAEQYPHPLTPIKASQIEKIREINPSNLLRFNRLTKIALIQPCLEQKAPDGGTYNAFYTEFKFLLGTDFYLREGNALSIIPTMHNQGYANIYAQGKNNYTIFEEEMRAIAFCLGIEIDERTQDFHQEIIITPASSEKLIASGLHYSQNYLHTSEYGEEYAIYVPRSCMPEKSQNTEQNVSKQENSAYSGFFSGSNKDKKIPENHILNAPIAVGSDTLVDLQKGHVNIKAL
jgi:hypothetical protein